MERSRELSLYGDFRLPKRFWDKVDISDSGCWMWTAQINCNGYGVFWLKEVSTTLSHRILFIVLIKTITLELDLDHLCRVRCCVNPDHLEPVTRAENLRRGRHRCENITHCPAGHSYSGDNLSMYGNNRQCRTCHRTKARERYAKRKQAQQ
jgi:hypothetical protein